MIKEVAISTCAERTVTNSASGEGHIYIHKYDTYPTLLPNKMHMQLLKTSSSCAHILLPLATKKTKWKP